MQPAPVEISPTQRDLWILRFYYLAWMGGAGFISPFLNLYFNRVGISGTQIGLMVSIGSVVALLSAPLWTRIGSLFRRSVTILQVSMLLTGILTLLLGQVQMFEWVVVIYALRVLVSAGANPVSDSITVRIVEKLEVGFGSVRVWGSIGWTFIVIEAGWLIQRYGFQAGFGGYLLAFCTAAGLLAMIRPEAIPPRTLQRRQLNLFSLPGEVIHNPLLIGLGLMIAINGLANAGVGQFESLYLDELGASESMIGVASMASAAVEILAMLWADRLVRRGKPASILLASLAIGIGLQALVFFFPSVATIIASRGIGGIGFSFYTIALIRFISLETSSTETATSLAIFTVTLPNLISMIGTPLGGLIFDRIGVHWLYLIGLVGSVLGGLVFGAVLRSSRRADHTC